MKHFWIETANKDEDPRAFVLRCARENCAAQWLISPAPKGARYRIKGGEWGVPRVACGGGKVKR